MSDINAFDLSAPQAETVIAYHDVDFVLADNQF
jgi:hypothetical protein